MGERIPLPSSVTQPNTRETSPVATSQEQIKPKDYSKQRRYAKTEKGKKAYAKAERSYRQTEKGKRANKEGVKRWRNKRKQQQVAQNTP